MKKKLRRKKYMTRDEWLYTRLSVLKAILEKQLEADHPFKRKMYELPIMVLRDAIKDFRQLKP